MSGQQS